MSPAAHRQLLDGRVRPGKPPVPREKRPYSDSGLPIFHGAAARMPLMAPALRAGPRWARTTSRTLREGDCLNLFFDSADVFHLQEDATKPDDLRLRRHRPRPDASVPPGAAGNKARGCLGVMILPRVLLAQRRLRSSERASAPGAGELARPRRRVHHVMAHYPYQGRKCGASGGKREQRPAGADRRAGSAGEVDREGA